MNIYIRNHDIDLYKYLSDSQIQLLSTLGKTRLLNATECLQEELTDNLVIAVDGRLDRIDKNEKLLGYVFPSEIDAEATAFGDKPLPYSLRALQNCTVILIDRHKLKELCDADPELNARIQAAINDTLCLKIVRLTHLES